MNLFRVLSHAIKSVFRRDQVDADMIEEMRCHREAQIESNLAAGLTPTEATRVANRQFGRIDAIAEEGREARGFTWLIHLRQDLRYGLKMLFKHKGFSFVAVMTLGLGLSVNITSGCLSLVDILFFQPLAVKDPHRLLVTPRDDPKNQLSSSDSIRSTCRSSVASPSV